MPILPALRALRSRLGRFRGGGPDGTEQLLAALDRLTDEATGLAPGRSGGPRVLMGPSFSIYLPSLCLDRLLADALRLRGAEVRAMYCDGIQTRECNFHGGVWGGGEAFAGNCERCHAQSVRTWSRLPGGAIPLSRHVTPGVAQRADETLSGLAPGEWAAFQLDGMPIGAWARDILVNNWVVGDSTRIPDHEALGREHVRNLLLVKGAYEGVLDDVRPDRVVSNDSFYGMWAILQHLCRTRGIPFYSHWPVTATRVAVARDDAAMNLDFRAAWPAFSEQPWTEPDRLEVDAWLSRAAGKRGLMIETSVLQEHQGEALDLGALDPGLPTALLPANVIWDLAALNKQVLFDDMMDWIASTVAWFAAHPRYQLIVKAHPAEQHPAIPETVERVEVALRERIPGLPRNVALLSPRVGATVYDLLPRAAVGIVHTSSVGFEMAALGLPVITTARAHYRGFGFTYDPATRGEYWEVLERLLAGRDERDQARRADLARRFVLLYQFHYYARLGLFEQEWMKPPRLLVGEAAELLPGRNPRLDWLVDAIRNASPIVSAGHWPPRS